MPPKRNKARARGKAPARGPATPRSRGQSSAAAAARPGRALKRRMILKLIQLEDEQGEPREMPRDVDLSVRYTHENLRGYMGSRLEVALEARAAVEARIQASDVVSLGDHRPRPAAAVSGTRGVGDDARTRDPARLATLHPGDHRPAHVAAASRARGGGEGARDRDPGRRASLPPEGHRPVPAEAASAARGGGEGARARGLDSLATLPPEVREGIFRHLLVSDRPVLVHSGWTTVYRHQRDRPSLDTAVLRACRALYAEGMRILYGENHFEYLVRDAAVPETHGGSETDGHPSPKDDDDGSDGEYDDEEAPDAQVTASTSPHDIDVSKVGPLMRRLTIRAEANRSGPAYRRAAARAIGTLASLSPRRANVHTLRIRAQAEWRAETGDVAFADWFRPGTDVMAALLRLPCRFIEFDIEVKGGARICERVNREHGAGIRRARRGDARFVIGNAELRREREEKAKWEFGVLMGIGKRIDDEGWRWRMLSAMEDELGHG